MPLPPSEFNDKGCICAYCCRMGAFNRMPILMECIQRDYPHLMKLMDAPNSKYLHSKCIDHLDEVLRISGAQR